MGLTMEQKKAVTNEIAKRYQKASKKQKGVILDEIVEITKYKRKYASWVLRNCGKEVFVRIDGELLRVKVGKAKKHRCKRREYDEKVLEALKKIWYIFDCTCGKRLAPTIKVNLEVLEKFNEIEVEPEVKEKLRRQFESLNPVELKRRITDLQDELFKLCASKKPENPC